MECNSPLTEMLDTWHIEVPMPIKESVDWLSVENQRHALSDCVGWDAFLLTCQ